MAFPHLQKKKFEKTSPQGQTSITSSLRNQKMHSAGEMIEESKLINAAKSELLIENRETNLSEKNHNPPAKEVIYKNKYKEHRFPAKGIKQRVTQASVVQIFVSANNLADLDLITQSDPLCTLKMKNGNTHGKYTKVGETEVVDNNLNPVWVEHFDVTYHPERK